MHQSQYLNSRANNQLKLARRVREGKEPDLIFIEGLRLISECIDAGLELIATFHRTSPDNKLRQLLSRILQTHCPLYEIDEPLLKTLSDTTTSQGVVVIARRPAFSLADVLPAHDPAGRHASFVILLDRVQDPGNVGTIVRTAEGAGVDGLLCTVGTVDPYSPKALRASMGSAFRLPIVTSVPVAAVHAATERAGMDLVSSAAEAAISYIDYDWRRPIVAVFGNEGAGIDAQLLAQSQTKVRIPLTSPVESLNVASSAAVILFEAARQRSQEATRQPRGSNQRTSKR